jgi:hypothetical protein
LQQWAAQGLGIRWIVLMVDDPNEGPPTASGAKTWKDSFGIDSAAVCPDPKYSLVPYSSFGTPLNTIIDPRTMKVVQVTEGYGGNYSALTSLAQSNK